uniref:Putative ixodes 8-cys protein n=1 Tax=Ixodes ricinus TaxID=34613 RepID=A0A0K8RF49_IXORI
MLKVNFVMFLAFAALCFGENSQDDSDAGESETSGSGSSTGEAASAGPSDSDAPETVPEFIGICLLSLVMRTKKRT